MKIVIAMDSFKGTLKAYEACQIVAKAITEYVPDAQVVIKPMADGGEGTAKAMIKNGNGQWISKTAMGPFADMQVEAGFGWFDREKIALVEMATASGLELISPQQANPLKTTTYGTGQLIKAALKYNPKKILLAIGGSATTDGGVGAAMALGWKFLDKNGKEVPLGGHGLTQIDRIERPKTFSLPPVQVLCDVDNPLCGKYGAARVYGPQKGATPKMVEQLDDGLSHLADLIAKKLHRQVRNIPGAGAAGGLAAGAIAFMNAALVSGIETVMAYSKLDEELKSAEWVITGEGSFDSQSLRGKVVAGIAEMALKSHTKVAVIAGQVSVARQKYQKLGIVDAFACKEKGMSVENALKHCRKLLYSSAQNFAREHLISPSAGNKHQT